MARFDRKVERTKKEYQFTQKEKVVETNKNLFKKNFNLKWVHLDLKTILVFIIDFPVPCVNNGFTLQHTDIRIIAI